MKISDGATARGSSPSFYTYLKPGALAKLRYSKITARSKQIGAQTLRALCQLKSGSDSPSPPLNSNGLPLDAIPCFTLRVKGYPPRCLQRKKLVAVTPFFSQAQT